MVSATYEQATGLFTIHTPLPRRFVGYSGHGRGRNNPDLQAVRCTGPIPRGVWTVSRAWDDSKHGPICFRLTPKPGTDTFGRSGFLIHGDNVRGDASLGCIILEREARRAIALHKVDTLIVVSLEGAKAPVRRAAA